MLSVTSVLGKGKVAFSNVAVVNFVVTYGEAGDPDDPHPHATSEVVTSDEGRQM